MAAHGDMEHVTYKAHGRKILDLADNQRPDRLTHGRGEGEGEVAVGIDKRVVIYVGVGTGLREDGVRNTII